MSQSKASKIPGTYRDLQEAFPEITQAHDRMATAVEGVGPLDEKTCALIKIGVSVGAGLESALRSHVRRAMQAGASQEEVVQAIFQGMISANRSGLELGTSSIRARSATSRRCLVASSSALR